MKKFLLTALSATLIASPILAAAPAEAQQRRVEQTVRHRANGTTVVHLTTTTVRPHYRDGWRKGERFDRRQARNYREVSNWRAYQGRRLYAPPRGYHWVRSGNDAVLVAVASGVIGAVVGGAFR